jgi:hypothetical protein
MKFAPILALLFIVAACSDGSNPSGAIYKMTVYSPEGTEVSQLTRYGTSLRYTAGGPMMIDAETGQMFSLPYVPTGARVEVIDLRTSEVVHSY